MEKNGSITNVEVKITLVALICATLRLLLAILSATGMFTPDVSVGWYNEYNESSTMMMNSTKVWLSLITYVAFALATVVYLLQIRERGFRTLATIAIVFWVLWITVDFSWLAANVQSVVCGEGNSLLRSKEYWQTEGIAEYPLIWLVLNHGMTLQWVLIVTGVLSHLLFIPTFASMQKENKVLGTLGIITMLAYVTTIVNIPFVSTFVQPICWVVLFLYSWLYYRSLSCKHS